MFDEHEASDCGGLQLVSVRPATRCWRRDTIPCADAQGDPFLTDALGFEEHIVWVSIALLPGIVDALEVGLVSSCSR
jgi:hypothetical protein